MKTFYTKYKRCWKLIWRVYFNEDKVMFFAKKGRDNGGKMIFVINDGWVKVHDYPSLLSINHTWLIILPMMMISGCNRTTLSFSRLHLSASRSSRTCLSHPSLFSPPSIHMRIFQEQRFPCQHTPSSFPLTFFSPPLPCSLSVSLWCPLSLMHSVV